MKSYNPGPSSKPFLFASTPLLLFGVQVSRMDCTIQAPYPAETALLSGLPDPRLAEL